MASVTFITSDMDKVRKEVRDLQEKRAIVLMTEISDLQKERELSSERIRVLEKTVTALQLEKAELVQTAQESQQGAKVLERYLIEEQLLVSDLKKKLEAAEKNAAQLSCQQSAVRNCCSRKDEESASPILSHHGILHVQSTPSPASHSPIIHKSRTHSSLGRIDSPSIVPRRYILAPTQQRSICTQTENFTESADQWLSVEETTREELAVSPDSLSHLCQGKEKLLLEIEKLQNKKKYVLEELKNLEEELSLKMKCESLKEQCKLLQSSLQKEFLQIKESLQMFEEDMDICKVIYSLHGSLSQENSVIENMRVKLRKSEKRCEIIQKNCLQLSIQLSEKEEELQKCLTWIQKNLAHRHSQRAAPIKQIGSPERRHTLK